jgi:ParB-like chromosome segregation protein Spo0J
MKLAAEKIEQVKVADLVPYVNNARTHTDDQITQIAASIKEFGWGAPILIDKDNGVIAGHARLAAAKKLKRATVPCVRLPHLTDAQRKALILADNRIAMNADWDVQLLAVELDELRDLKVDLSLLGFAKAELNDLIGTPNTPGGTIYDESRHLLLVECKTEPDLRALFEEMKERGLECKLMS